VFWFSMNDPQVSITREQRDQIVKATGAIRRRVQEMLARPTTQADVFVISTNLTIIQANVSDLPRAGTN
jgi:hypothetical protein